MYVPDTSRTGGLRDHLENTLEDVEYLARSSNRIRILSLLSETPLSTRRLSEEIGMSRATLGRILHELVDRGWVEREGRTYGATHLGEFVIVEFTSMLERLNSIQVLNRTARWFPEEHFEFDLHALATAEVITTTRTDVMAPLTHLARQVRNGDRVSILSHAMLPNCIEACHRGIEHGQHMEMIVTPAVVASIRANRELVDTVREILGTNRVHIARFDGDVPFVYVVTDGEVNIVLFDEGGAPHAVLCSDDPDVLSWAHSTFEEYRSTSTPLEASAFIP